ncbi:A24 family peptidase [Glaciimonas immobilis]|uniref:Prepilin peptidase CpaA n=1 Tax=Glaciimonas immobilis TaxID=728004 RepID=A0A840RN84_9BURK|nr:prepilin peptidase [Glaciimonas immobilis]KAF3998821.1 prepilin peptidase [Glaciimonas immobilis]MBB5198204.1 prepilin peptidase CpaA [Glaciimonas immobilis]
MSRINLGLLILFVTWCSVHFVYDMLVRRVPNKLLILAIILQIGCFALTGQGFTGISPLRAITGFAIGLAFLLPLYALRAMGAGDVKFFAVVGLLLGPVALLPVFLMGSVLAGMHALVFTASKSGLVLAFQSAATRLDCWMFYQRLISARGNRAGIPYAAYLAVGAITISIFSRISV